MTTFQRVSKLKFYQEEEEFCTCRTWNAVKLIYRFVIVTRSVYDYETVRYSLTNRTFVKRLPGYHFMSGPKKLWIFSPLFYVRRDFCALDVLQTNDESEIHTKGVLSANLLPLIKILVAEVGWRKMMNVPLHTILCTSCIFRKVTESFGFRNLNVNLFSCTICKFWSHCSWLMHGEIKISALNW